MSLSSLSYAPPIRKDAVARTLDYNLLETATEQYDAGDFLASTVTVFRHLFPDGEAPDLTQPFAFTQGSSRVTARIEDGVCYLSVPMIRLPQGGGVAALRYLLQRINGSGQMFQARLHGDDVHLEFNETLSALHPQKLLEVLRRMPVRADQHDDWMIGQFGVTALERGEIAGLTDDDAASAAQQWVTHWHEVDELLKEALRKRSQFFLNEVTAYALHRIRFALPLAGTLLPQLMEAANIFNDAELDPRKRESSLVKCIKDMRAITSDELRKHLGHVEYAISPHSEGTPARLASFFGPGNYLDTIEKFRSSGQSMDATLPLASTYYYLLATHTWPPEIAAAMKEGLAAAADKPWREAANLLLNHAKALVEEFGDEDEDDDDDDDDEEAEGEGDSSSAAAADATEEQAQ